MPVKHRKTSYTSLDLTEDGERGREKGSREEKWKQNYKNPIRIIKMANRKCNGELRG